MHNSAPPAVRYALNLMIDDAARLLLLRRALHAGLGADQWGLPAGKIEAGESPLMAARREMDEEIGSGHRVDLVRYLGPIRDSFYGGRLEIHLFEYRWHGGRVVLNDEHTAYAWVAKEAIRDYDVMPGIEEDIVLLGIWPQRFLNPERIPDYLKT